MGGGIQQVLSDLAIGGISGAVTKTAMSPIERVKLLMQTQDSNPDVISGKVQRYTGIGDCFRRVQSEQGFAAFWRGNLVNCIRYAPQQGSALAFNDAIKQCFPKYNTKTHFWQSFGTNLLSGGLAGGIANTICYPFDCAHSFGLRCGQGQEDFQWHYGLHHEDGPQLWSYRTLSWMEHHGGWCFRVSCWTARHFCPNHGDESLQRRQGHGWNGSRVRLCAGGS